MSGCSSGRWCETGRDATAGRSGRCREFSTWLPLKTWTVFSGKYFVDCHEVEPSKDAQDTEDARRLWSAGALLVGLGDGF
jgi:hypothetical protein